MSLRTWGLETWVSSCHSHPFMRVPGHRCPRDEAILFIQITTGFQVAVRFPGEFFWIMSKLLWLEKGGLLFFPSTLSVCSSSIQKEKTPFLKAQQPVRSFTLNVYDWAGLLKIDLTRVFCPKPFGPVSPHRWDVQDTMPHGLQNLATLLCTLDLSSYH